MRTRRIVMFGLSIALLAGAAGCKKPGSAEGASEGTEQGKEAFGKLTIQELEAKMADAKAGKGKLAIFDNNQKESFDKGHIPGAKWVKFNDVGANDLPADKETTLVFYCSNEH